MKNIIIGFIILFTYQGCIAQSNENDKIIAVSDSLSIWLNELSIHKKRQTNIQSHFNKVEEAFEYSVDKLNTSIKLITDSIFIKNNRNKLDDLSEKTNQLSNEIINDYKKYVKNKIDDINKHTEKLKLKIKNNTRNLSGAHRIKFKNISYRIFIVDNNLHDVKLHWKNPTTNKRFINIQNLIKYYQDTLKISPLMITNAGMYTPEKKPQGLYIENNQTIIDIDTLKKQGNLNFYLKPNGVFWIDSNSIAHVSETNEFYKNISKTKGNTIKYATQSGPMLVINNEIHSSFTNGSTNTNIRSGVGIIDNNRSVYIISDQEVNFYDFATVFKDIFGCKNALYLDGAISLMYIQDISKNENGGDFGPMISIIKK
jgi:uncharacterized protein YigE (DUF2233 family)